MDKLTKTHKIAKTVCIIAASALIIPRIIPILIAVPVSWALSPVISHTSEKLRVKRGIVSVFICAVFLGVLMLIAGIIMYRGVSVMTGLLKRLPEAVSPILNKAESKAYKIIIAAPPEMRDRLQQILDSSEKSLAGVPEKLVSKILTAVTAAASDAPGIIFGIVTFAIALFFVSGAFPEYREFCVRQMPEKLRERACGIKSCVSSCLCHVAKSELILCGITFCELTAGFLILGVGNPVAVALLTAVIDMLPVFGTGIVLIPWAVIELVQGRYLYATGFAVLYAVCVIVRSVTEPKMLGGKAGVHPAVSLAALYFGSKTLGVGGMLLCPLAVMIAKQLYDCGYLRIKKGTEVQ